MAENKLKTILVVDNCQFIEFSLKLTDYFSTVYYCNPAWKNGFPRLVEARVGTEWKNGKQLPTFDNKQFIAVEDLFDYIDKVDVIFFPDCYYGDLQQWLFEKGYRIFGNKKAEELELERWDTQEYFKSLGMDVTKHERIIGLDNLKDNLKKNPGKNRWVKISKYRKLAETFNGKDYNLVENQQLGKMQWENGPVSKTIEYILEDNIDAIVEEGSDGYTVDGQYPTSLIQGVEKKDKGYVGQFVPFASLSKGVRKVLGQISSILKNYKARGFFSTEIRTTKDGKNYLIDPAMRLPSPPNELYQEMYKNLGEIIYKGAFGELINPECDHKFGIEVIITSDWFTDSSIEIQFPKEYRNNVKIKNLCIIDGKYYALNLHGHTECGALVATGNSFEECKSKLEKMAPEIKGPGLEIDLSIIDSTVEDYNKMVKSSK